MEPKDWITIIGISATFLLGIVNIIISITNNSRAVFVNSVTRLRSEWLKELKINISNYYTLCIRLRHSREPDVMECIKELQQITACVSLNLNPEDEDDNKLVDRMEKINTIIIQHFQSFCSDDFGLDNELDLLFNEMKQYSKLEWEGIKLESRKGSLGSNDKKKLKEEHYYSKMKKTKKKS
jgi:hypothetical protein